MNDDLSPRLDLLIHRPDDISIGEHLNNVIHDLEPDQIALLLEGLPLEQRFEYWFAVPDDLRIEVLVEMRNEARTLLLQQLSSLQMDQLLSGLDAETLIELSEALPDEIVDLAFRRMDEHQREHYQRSAQYDDDAIGRYLDHELLVLPQNSRLRDANRLLRRERPPLTSHIWLVDRTGRFAAAVSINTLFGEPPHRPLIELTDEQLQPLDAATSLKTATEQFEHAEVSALPVVDSQGVLLGRMTSTLAFELLREQYESQLMAGAGLNEEVDLFAPIWHSSKRRATWLGINLLTALLASWSIGLFEGTLQQVVALAVLMPIVASMGGIAGSQTLTLIIRGLALGQISPANVMPLLKKELSVGALNGVLWAVVIGVVAGFWFSAPTIGVVIGLAIIVNISIAALAGVFIPVILQKLKIDPALSGSVILTTVTDVVGFVVFLGLGSLFLL